MRYVLAVFLLIAGCTPPTQPVAERAMDLVNGNNDKIVNDFSNISYQLSLDKAVEKVSKNPNQAKEILEQMGHEYEIIESRRLAYERGKQLGVIVKLHVYSGKGFLNIFAKELEDAKNKVDTDRAAVKSDK